MEPFSDCYHWFKTSRNKVHLNSGITTELSVQIFSFKITCTFINRLHYSICSLKEVFRMIIIAYRANSANKRCYTSATLGALKLQAQLLHIYHNHQKTMYMHIHPQITLFHMLIHDNNSIQNPMACKRDVMPPYFKAAISVCYLTTTRNNCIADIGLQSIHWKHHTAINTTCKKKHPQKHIYH